MKHHQTAKEKELADNERLLSAWRKLHREQREEALAGLHADVMQRLIAQLKDLRSARELVAFMEAQDWSVIDADTRLVVLHEINQAITRLRERADLPPIDDALPGEPLRAFQLIKKVMDQFPAPSGEAKPDGYIRASDE
jgi:hypothetical protein